MNTRLVRFLLIGVALSFTAEGAVHLDVDEELRRAQELRELYSEKERIPFEVGEGRAALKQGREDGMHISAARNRVAVFPFEDPDETGIADALSALLGREILTNSGVRSLGVLRYEGSLAPSAEQPLGYFDKVDLLVDSQRVTLAIWGVARRDGDDVLIDTFLQLPAATLDSSFTWRVQLPAAMGGDALVSRLRPSRIFVQRVTIPFASAKQFVDAARMADELRAEPGSIAIKGRLPVGTVYRVVAEQDGWVRVKAGDLEGWTRRGASCAGDCEPLLQTARFAADLLLFRSTGRVPDVRPTLSAEAALIVDQLSLMSAVSDSETGALAEVATKRLQRVIDRSHRTSRAQPGGGSLTNMAAMAVIGAHVRARSVSMAFDEVDVDTDLIRMTAFELANAAQSEPRNADLLHNMAVLFRSIGDEPRAELAARLERDAAAPMARSDAGREPEEAKAD